MSRVGGWLRRGAVQVTVVAVGLGLGIGGTALYRARTSNQHYSLTPSAKRFSFAPAAGSPVPSAPPPDVVPSPDAEPADATAALTAFLQAEATGHPDVAWALLDASGHARWPTAPAWLDAQPDLPVPVAFQMTPPGVAPAAAPPPGAVDLHVDVTRNPSLDPFRGLVAARSAEVWRVGDENGHWRVAATPVDSRPVLPPDSAAPAAVQGWVDRLSACDQAGAAALQVDPNLLGPADIAAAPCQLKQPWTVGSPVGIDRGGDVQPLLAAYGQGAGSWARLVPVRAAGRNFWAEVAPLGDAWMVVGVAAGG
ncbi:MAG: hypothetical protein ACR2LJ_01420 [Acidimicrobiales bacterium]